MKLFGIELGSWNRRPEPEPAPAYEHSLPMIDATGKVVYVLGTCTEMDELRNAAHVRREMVSDGKDGWTQKLTILSCEEAESERLTLLADNERLETELGRANRATAAYRAGLERAEGLISRAFLIIFGLGPSLKTVLSEDVSTPKLSEDKTAVKLEGVYFSIIMEPFHPDGERIRVVDIDGTIEEGKFPIPGGHVSKTVQAAILGHITRIRQAHADGGTDPVAADIDLASDSQRVSIPVG